MLMINRPHYAWLVCAGGALSLSTVMGLGANVFTIYQPEILSFHQFTNAQGSWITTTRSLFILLTLFVVNQLCRWLGLRTVMVLGNLLMGLSCFSFSRSGTFPMYLFSAALLGIGYCLGGMVPLSLLINNWFRDRRGLALGLASAGSGISTVLAPPIITDWIQTHGLHAAFFREGIFVLFCAGLIWLLLRSQPEDMGLTPYTASAPDPTPRPASAPKPRANRPRAQKLVVCAAVLIGGPIGPCFSHLGVYYTCAGFDRRLVALLISMMGIAICLGKILCGHIYDRLGGRRGNHFVFCVFLLGLILCCLAGTRSVAIAVAAIALFSVGMSVTAVPPAAWARDLASEEHYAELVRSFTLAYTAGMLLFGPVPGMIADHTGSYMPAYLLFAGFLLTAYLVVWCVYRHVDRDAD